MLLNLFNHDQSHNRNYGSMFFATIVMVISCLSCNENTPVKQKTTDVDALPQKGTYGYDVLFLKKYQPSIIELISEDGRGKLLVSPGYQGRVMTSTADGDSGTSFGWINYPLIASGEKRKQFNPVGGEERFWLGPEGGQFSLYFKRGDSFNITSWQVPALIDTVSYHSEKKNSKEVVFTHQASLVNFSGTPFELSIERKILILEKKELETIFHIDVPAGINSIGYASENSIQNTGTSNWEKEKGLLSIWLLGMFTPSGRTVVIIPFHPQQDAKKFITDDYFGKIPQGRLMIKDSVLFFTCDGKMRSKIGLSPAIAKPIAGSYDFNNKVLTILSMPVKKEGLYVNSKWELQQQPFKGDVVNAYNDGPLKDGSQLGPFYELESSSNTVELKKGEKLQYRQVTCHFQGDEKSLRKLAMQLLSIDLDDLPTK